MASRWLPNVEDFFDSLYRCICSAQQLLESGESGDYDYWLRHLESYEPTQEKFWISHFGFKMGLNWDFDGN